ncbi:MAG: glutamine synthetase III [Clostridia bacterium]|nr:glutamine synthetase III [Clostridia bacterium]
MANLNELFGIDVFNDAVMQQRLPKDTYKALKKTIDDGRHLDPEVAAIVAHAMKEWAVERGVTHYTHWFQPMTGITAEKHDSFISPQDGGKMILSFSGKELVRGEPDASSFPSGGLRSTFEARGYTAWDPTSYAFIKDGVLCIPTAFCSYGGEALDKKTPLLRSMEALSKQAVRVLHLFGRKDATRVMATVGPEQEYFLVDKKLHDQRKDLIFTGRTLFGANPPKGQEMDDHYFGSIKPRVHAFMDELNESLWRLGVLAKTQHNEAAPSQHELAPIFAVANIACDHNQLTMELMKKIAHRHGLECLLAEKPFAGVNGSGKHNNWSMTTNTGYNLLEPGDSPYDSAQFLLFLTAVIKAVDDYQDMLRVSVATAGNDHRLGGNEAPPAIISIFLGDELTEILDAIDKGVDYHTREHSDMAIGVHVLPKFPKDTTDRNRTSPFAFTGNKFEFRSLGASASISDANVVLNTSVAESLRQYADELENASDFEGALHKLIVREIRAHKRIIFNGNNYTAAWVEEAQRRGLLNLPSAIDALPCMTAAKNIELFTRHRVFTETELHARCEIMLENYAKIINIEAKTTLLMARQEILPAVMRFTGEVAQSATAIKAVSPALQTTPQEKLLMRLTAGCAKLSEGIDALQEAVDHTKRHGGAYEGASYEHDVIIPAMNAVRAAADELEPLVEKRCWPFPTYTDLLFYT